jgi:hypothetical protein
MNGVQQKKTLVYSVFIITLLEMRSLKRDDQHDLPIMYSYYKIHAHGS